MPIRSRSHELEEESVTQFRDLLPSKWVPRSKLPDYGIDLEVELFDNTGESTGLVFQVQLRATDDISKAALVRLEIDELDYYSELESPVLVSRYCSKTKNFYWEWASVIFAQKRPRPGQKSLTYRFTDEQRWDDSTAARISRTLEVRRLLKRVPAGAQIPIRLQLDGLPASERYAVDRAITNALNQSDGVLWIARGEPQALEILVAPEPGFLAVRIDSLHSATFDLEDTSAQEIVTSTLYAIIRILLRVRLTRQAETTAKIVLALGKAHHNEELAFVACQALGADLLALVDLAILNGFHMQSSAYYAPIILTISQASQNAGARTLAIDKFFAPSLLAARLVGSAQESAVEYSMGNFYRDQHKMVAAMRHYNRARKLRPAYLKTEYFLREVGGVLYLGNRHACAVKAYTAAQALDDTPLLALLLGDSLLMSGRAAEALKSYQHASEHGPSIIAQEATLKARTIAWLLKSHSGKILPTRRAEADKAMRDDGADKIESLLTVVTEVDALNPLARFNIGVSASKLADHSTSLNNLLLCAFVQPFDCSAWANAAIGAIALGDSSLLISILSVGTRSAGEGVYDQLRADLIVQGASDAVIEILDGVALEMLKDANSSIGADFTLRILNGDEFETMTFSRDNPKPH